MDEILAALERLERKIDTTALEQRNALGTMQAEVVGVKADLATFRLDVMIRLGTIIDEIAAFRAEYNNHTHD